MKTTTKKCIKCGQERSVLDFHSDSSRGDGLNPRCKSCVFDYQQTRREHTRALARERYRAHREEELERSMDSYDQNQATSAKIASKHRKPWTDEEDEFIRSNPGMTIYQLAIRLGRTYSAVHSRIYK